MPTTGTMRYLKIGDATYEVYDTNDDTKVYQSYKAASGYTYWRPLIIGYSSGLAETFTPADQTNLTYTFDTLKVQPSSGTIRFGAAALANGSYTNTISADTLTANRTLTAPNKSGTIALTSDISTAIAELPTPMSFKGSVGTGGTITSLPAAAAANEGFTYKVITALSTPVTAKVGDTVISSGSEWIVIPSGDEPSGTVTSVGLANATNGGLTISGSPVTSNGTISIGHSNVLASAQTTQAVYPITIDKNGHISGYGTAVTIPIVNNATLTIQKNGVNVETFSANASSNKTANIVVNEVPSGGTSGQFLTKDSGADYDVTWTTPALFGSTTNKTPTQVKNALDDGYAVNITHFDNTYGMITANNFNASAAAGVIVANVVFYYTGVGLLCFELIGNLNTDTWANNIYMLAQSSDIHNVPSGGTTGQVLMKNSNTNYDCSWANLPIYNGGVS